MVVGLDREQRGVKANLSPKASLLLNCACALEEVQSSAASSCQAASQVCLRNQRKHQQPWGSWGCIQLLTTDGSATTHQQSKSPLPEKTHGEKLPKSNTILVFIEVFRVAKGAVEGGC